MEMFDAVWFSSDFDSDSFSYWYHLCGYLPCLCRLLGFALSLCESCVYRLKLFYFGGSFHYAFLIIFFKFKVQEASLVVGCAADSFHAILPLDFRIFG